MSDLISRSELIGWLKGKKYTIVDETSDTMSEDFENKHKWELSRNCFINDVIKHIQTQSAVEVESMTAEWIKHERAEECNGILVSNYECSNCHACLRKNTSYCPECESKMKGE